mmetsp:Transcript_11043/g.36222  ORF Transcript_11043/g.36222 Transcript_11043/m.36222 type:complete len:381 (+) Transcript_11043:1087-2229(+)
MGLPAWGSCTEKPSAPVSSAPAVAEASASECTATSPENEADERRAGRQGDHCTSNVQLAEGGSSQSTSPVAGSQQSVRLSLPDEMSKFSSCGHHDAVRMPLEWPVSSLTGANALRKSQICMLGKASSSEATMICVATSGFHAMTELRCPRFAELVKLMTGFLSLRSHTTERPLCDVDARMCVTLRFHATQEMSAPGPGDFAPGETTRGVDGFVRSVMKTSDSAAPEASSSGTAGLNSSPRTGPEWESIVATTGASWRLMSRPGSTICTLPLAVPAASSPYGSEPSATPLVPHVSRLKRSLHASEPTSGSSAPPCRSSEKTSRCEVESNVSDMAPATVPAASKPECSLEDDHATVAERGMLPTLGISAGKTRSAKWRRQQQ